MSAEKKNHSNQLPILSAKVFSVWVETHREDILKSIDKLLIVLAVCSISSLIGKLGFELDQSLESVADGIESTMLYLFALQAFLKLSLSPNKRAHLKSRWLELMIFAIILFYLIFPFAVKKMLSSLNPQLTPETLTGAYLVITQFLVVIALVPVTLRYSGRLMTTSIQPSGVLLGSFIFFALVGAGLLMLPKASAGKSLSFIDALFMSTSAVCVTGLSTVDTATSFSHLGHWIILALIQIGGLGIMTLTTFFSVVAGGSSKLKEYTALRELLGEESIGKVRSILFQIGFYTIIVEALGAFLIYNSINHNDLEPTVSPIFFSVFHSLSAFCNAGFSLLSSNLSDPIFYGRSGFLYVIMFLVIVGGLGFPALASLSFWVKAKLQKEANARLTIHAKIVFLSSGFLIAFGTIGTWLLESQGALSPYSASEKFTHALFHSVVSRTAGFNTIDASSLTNATLFLTIVLMWIGASPSSTGGGIKTTTATLAILNIYAIASGRNKIELFHRRISDLAVTRAFSTALLSLLYIASALFLLLITEQEYNVPFHSLLFEVVSAVSTVGLSTGVTSGLSDLGKLVIISSMIIGRVGFLTVIIALTKKRSGAKYDYAEESVIVS